MDVDMLDSIIKHFIVPNFVSGRVSEFLLLTRTCSTFPVSRAVIQLMQSDIYSCTTSGGKEKGNYKKRG